MTSATLELRAETAGTAAPHCRGCRTPARAGAHFCIVCGRRFSAAVSVDLLVHRSRGYLACCERCTAPVRSTRFCTVCGTERRIARVLSA